MLALHQKMGLMVAFAFYPTAARSIFSMLRACTVFDFGDEGTRHFLAVDTSKDCESPAYNLYYAYAIVLVFLIVIAVPMVFLVMLVRQLSGVVPAAKDEPMRLRIRANNAKLDGISFLFKVRCADCQPLLHSRVGGGKR